MTDTFSPPVWRRRVANELRRLRETAGLSQRDAAQHLGCRVPKISLMESGQRNIRVDDLTKLLEFYKVPEADHAHYITAAERSRGRAWWEQYEDGVISDGLSQYLAFEEGAYRIRSFSTAVHGLLQTPGYATAVFRQYPTQPSDEVVRRRVAVRMKRARLLTRENDPLQFRWLFDESVLHRMIGGRAVMAAQLHHIAQMVRNHSNITAQVIPYSEGATWMEFAILSYPWPDDPGIVYIEHFAGGVFLHSLDEVDTHTRAFRGLRDQALSPEASLRLIESTADSYSD
jgi:transcriptional regulator with XRE-family HTH domain